MLDFISQSERVTEVGYYHEYRLKDLPDAGASFPCSEDGTIEEGHTDEMYENYERVKNSDKYKYLGIVPREYSYTKPAVVQDECGVPFELENQHMGACQCPKCGNWYNLFGQELLPPEQWGSEYDDPGERYSPFDDLY